jgi:hypothetical protein
MTRTVTLVALAVSLPLVALAAPPPPPDAARQPASAAAPAGDLAALLAESDEAYARRDEAAELAVTKARLAEAEKLAPGDFEVLWRLARLNVWLADDLKISGEEKSRLGKIAWDFGDRATSANPARVEGWYWSAAGMGLYGLGIGVLTALHQGIEPKFKERLGNAERIDAGYQHGGVQTAWGRFYFKLPWPKYDPRKSEEQLVAALQRNPANVRAHVYLAELLAKEDRSQEAQAQLQAAIAKPPGQYDPPEERRWQEEAKRLLRGR